MSNPMTELGYDFDKDPRDYALGLTQENIVIERELLTACLMFMSHDDVKQMLDDNELSPRFF